MAMNRRGFIKVMLSAAAVLAGGSVKLLQTLTPARFTRADKAKKYPGRIKRLNLNHINKIAPWSG